MEMDLQWFNFAPNGQVQTFVDSFINRTLPFHFWDGDIGETIILMFASEPKLCANNCGSSVPAANLNFCTKCFEDLLVEEQAAIAKAKMEDSFNSKSTK
ncbi:hypothetical protein Patl1_05114 [Pistacia atlantica]|uniref:Uncharacterized protein n=1 Tax=Pistacia atlantica TaxID=434234 RepID=A0ACC1BQ89_9ROSI|nr:hypothetical protein Patl1_05114 [Pistacia atlantica]